MTEPFALLALDVGDARIGVAVANSIAKLPRPLVTIPNDEHVWERLKKIIHTEDVKIIVVGLPRNQSGEETAQTEKNRQFAKKLESHTEVPIYEQDESLTSVKAEMELAKRGGYGKLDVDALAATYILEDYLAEHREVR